MMTRGGINRRAFLETMVTRTGAGLLGAKVVTGRASELQGGPAGEAQRRSNAPGAAIEPAPESGRAAETPRVPVVDTHLHCFAGRGDARFPYHPRGPYQPEKAASPEHLLELMVAAGVDYAVVVHPEPYQDDHRYLDHCLEVGRGKLKGTCLFFAEQPDAPRRLREYAGRHAGQLIAARIHAYNPDRLPPFGKPELEALWKTASDLGLAIQLHLEPRYAPGFDPLIREFPKTLVLIDHLGRPLQGTEKEYEVIVKWSQLENTVMKLSALPEKREYPHRDIAPFVKRLTAAWGSQRLLYGGGYGETATKESYRAYRERLREYLAHLSAADQAAILGGNAARLFGMDIKTRNSNPQ